MKIITSKKSLNDPRWLKALSERGGLIEETSEVLVSARVKMGMTQNELAKSLHTTQSVIARVENGRNAPSLSLIDRIAGAYKTNARITFESMPDIVPVAVQYANMFKPDITNGDSQFITRPCVVTGQIGQNYGVVASFIPSLA